MTPYLDVLGVDDNEQLALRIQQGDRAAETRFVHLYCDCVFAMALGRTRDRDAARELVDDVLMAVILALRSGAVRDRGHLGGFVHGTALNKIHGYFRKQRQWRRALRLQPASLATEPLDDAETQDRWRMAREAMAFLHDSDREILRLNLVEGLKPGEIAARLKLSPALVRQRKCRALRAIVAYAGDRSANSYQARGMLRR